MKQESPRFIHGECQDDVDTKTCDSSFPALRSAPYMGGAARETKARAVLGTKS